MTAPREILIIKPSSLGDVVHTLPAVALIKKHWPESRLRWLVNPEWAPLLEGNPYMDEVLIFPRQKFRGLRGILGFPSWARDFGRRVQADLVLDFQCLFRSGFIARQCCAPGGRIVGLSDAREGAGLFYHQKADVSGISHAVDRYLALVSTLGISSTAPLEWPLPAGQAPAGFQEAPPFILLHPFSRGAGKSLSPADVAAFCHTVAPMRVVLAGRSEETVPALENVENLLNRTTLAELIWLIRRAAFVVSVDSGPMHIAAAITPRLLSIHTWSDPAKVGPYRPEAWVWKDGSLLQANRRGNSASGELASDISAVAQFVQSRL
jgi:ADP-heptose:LPS heptosyltransferase